MNGSHQPTQTCHYCGRVGVRGFWTSHLTGITYCVRKTVCDVRAAKRRAQKPKAP